MSGRTEISWLPSWVPRDPLETYAVGDSLECIRPAPEGWPSVANGLRRAATELRTMSIRQIVGAIDDVAERWCDRDFDARKRARDLAVRATGFSPEAIERSFDVELRNYRADSLWRTLRRELGDPRVLDTFRGNDPLGGMTHAIGPELTAAVFTGNVPGLPALSIVRALLVKSAVVAKVASGEPTFAARFAESLHDVEPRLGDAVLVTYWDRDDHASRDAVFGCADAVVVYGGDEACAAMRAAVPDRVRYIEHGHKFSAGIVDDHYLKAQGADKVAERVVVDTSVFNQHACIAPQAYIVVGGAATARRFAREVARAMDVYASACPLGRVPVDDAAAIQLRRAEAAWDAAADSSGGCWTAEGLDWTVVVSRELGGAGTGNRFIRIVPADSVDRALELLRPLGPVLQNVGLGVSREDFDRVALELARIGASRVSAPGRMAEPSLMWKHDGRSCVADLVRWCDGEMLIPDMS